MDAETWPAYTLGVRRWLGLKDLIADAAVKTTDLVQESHQSVTTRVFRYVKWVPTLREPAELAERVEGSTSAVVYASVRLGTQLASRLVDVGYRLTLSEETAGIQTERQGRHPEIAQRQGEGQAPRQADQLAPAQGQAPAQGEARADHPAQGQAQRQRAEIPTPMSSAAVGTAAWTRDAALGVLNGVVGDFLLQRDNTLRVEMSLRRGGELVRPADLATALPGARRKLCVFVHGLACTEWSWSAYAEQTWGDPLLNYGALLESQLGFSVLYLRYNSGLRIATNGRELAQLLEQVVAAYPAPLEEIVLIGHSMGGLVSRSAAHYADQLKLSWVERLTHLICLGSPHHGAPLEKAGHLLTSVLLAFDTPGTQVPAKVINARSAGIKDLRFGALLDEDWDGVGVGALLDDRRKPVHPLPHVKYHFAAGSISQDPEHPVGQLLGDLMVRPGSARGQHPDRARAIGMPAADVFLVGGVSHVGLVNHPRVYQQLVLWLSSAAKEPQ